MWVIGILLLAACSSVKVNYDYDRDADYAAYSSFGYFPQMVTGLSPLNEKRLLNILAEKMESKGFNRSETPDLYVNIYSRIYAKPQSSSISIGMGGTGGNVGGGLGMAVPVGGDYSERREIVFDVVDVKKDELIWQAVSETAYKESTTPLKREEKLQKVVDQVFSNFPPERK